MYPRGYHPVGDMYLNKAKSKDDGLHELNKVKALRRQGGHGLDPSASARGHQRA
jgi:hypothetical protein